MSPPCLQKHFRHIVVVLYPLLRYGSRPGSRLIAVSALLHGLGRFSQPVLPLEEIRRRGNVPATLLFPCVRVLPLAQSIKDAGQARKGTVGLKSHPFAFRLAPASPVRFRERLEELVKGHGRLPRFGGRVLFRLETFNARARVKHALVFFFWRRKRGRWLRQRSLCGRSAVAEREQIGCVRIAGL